IAVADITVKLEAFNPLNLTAVTPVKFVPLIVTRVPTVPFVGVKLEIVGATAKLVALVAVPPGVVTLSGPVVALDGTVALIVVAEVTVKAAPLPLKFTAVAPVNVVPVIVTLAPTGPKAGVKLVIVGDTMKLAVLVAVPPGVVTLSGPVVAASGTVVWIAVSDMMVKAVA